MESVYLMVRTDSVYKADYVSSLKVKVSMPSLAPFQPSVSNLSSFVVSSWQEVKTDQSPLASAWLRMREFMTLLTITQRALGCVHLTKHQSGNQVEVV
jgi:hypothetical protein